MIYSEAIELVIGTFIELSYRIKGDNSICVELYKQELSYINKVGKITLY